MGAIGFLIDNNLFTGDVLFGGGSGRIFEGTAADMMLSLDRIAALNDDTSIYFGHEYTAGNLRFAATVEPKNADVHRRARLAGEVTTPSSLGMEKDTNPFLRIDQPVVIDAINDYAQADIINRADRLGVLRSWKNAFDRG